MPGMMQMTTRPEHVRGAPQRNEGRRYKRVDLELQGRYMRRLTKEEFACQLVDISIGGAGLTSETPPQIGESVVIHFDELGGLEGVVVRSNDRSFAVNFVASHRRRQKLGSQITWLLNRHELAIADQRRSGHERIALAPKPVPVAFRNSAAVKHHVLDVSISGASIAMLDRPEIGSELTVGTLPAKVVRHHSRGIGVEFNAIQPFDLIREEFG